MPIRGCKDKDTERFLAGQRVKGFEGFSKAAAKALTRLQAATTLKDLRNPTSNRFKALEGDRNGQYSIRINDQHRICFKWAPTECMTEDLDVLMGIGDSDDVEINKHYD